MEKANLKVGMRVHYPETVLNCAGVGLIDKDGKSEMVFGTKDQEKVFVILATGGSLFFPIADLTEA